MSALERPVTATPFTGRPRRTAACPAFALAVAAAMWPAPAAAQDVTVPATDQEWEQLWATVNANSYHLRGLGRERGSEIVAAAIATRADGYLWGALGGITCNVDGPTRAALRDDERAAEFDAARTCLERIRSALPDTGSVELEYVRSMLTRSLAETLVEVGRLSAADSLAARELDSVARGAPDPGNIEYEMNQVRGLVALRRQRRDLAVEFLDRSAGTRGSPQLASFGPRLVLARELLEAGEVDAVLRFIDRLRTVWQGPAAEAFLAETVAAIRDGRIPDGPRWR